MTSTLHDRAPQPFDLAEHSQTQDDVLSPRVHRRHDQDAQSRSRRSAVGAFMRHLFAGWDQPASSGHAESRSEMILASAGGHRTPNAGSSQRAPLAASGWYSRDIW
jgi:hypothetical protein